MSTSTAPLAQHLANDLAALSAGERYALWLYAVQLDLQTVTLQRLAVESQIALTDQAKVRDCWQLATEARDRSMILNNMTMLVNLEDASFNVAHQLRLADEGHARDLARELGLAP